MNAKTKTADLSAAIFATLGAAMTDAQRATIGARIKRVHKDSQVAHLWANESQDSARNSRDTFYFNGPVIYSYRNNYPIYTLTPWRDSRGRRVVVGRTDSYSNTTSGHKSEASRALNGHPVHIIRVDPTAAGARLDGDSCYGSARDAALFRSVSEFMEACATGQRAAFVAIVRNLATQAQAHAKTGDERHKEDGAAYYYREAAEKWAHALDMAAAAPDAVTRKACAAALKGQAPDVPPGFIEWGAHEYAAPVWEQARDWSAFNRARAAHAAAFTGDVDALKTAALEYAKAKRRAVREAAKARALNEAIKTARGSEAVARDYIKRNGRTPQTIAFNADSGTAEGVMTLARAAAAQWTRAEKEARKAGRKDDAKRYKAKAAAMSALESRYAPAAAVEAVMRNTRTARDSARTMRRVMAKDAHARRHGFESVADPAGSRRIARTSAGTLGSANTDPRAYEAATRIPRLLAVLNAKDAETRRDAMMTARANGQRDNLADAAAAVAALAQGRGALATIAADAVHHAREAWADAADVGARLWARYTRRNAVARFTSRLADARALVRRDGVTLESAPRLVAAFRSVEEAQNGIGGLAQAFRDRLPFGGPALAAGNNPLERFGLDSEMREAWREADALHAVASALAQPMRTITAFDAERIAADAADVAAKAARGEVVGAAKIATRVKEMVSVALTALDEGIARTSEMAEREQTRGEYANARALAAIRKARAEMIERRAGLVDAMAAAAPTLDAAQEAAREARANLLAHWRKTGEAAALSTLNSAGITHGAVFRFDAARGVIVSSLGAEVSERAGRRLWALIRRTVETGRAVAYEWGKGPSVGPFHLDSIAADGETRVGCHWITASEARAFAEFMKWPPFGDATDADALADESAAA